MKKVDLYSIILVTYNSDEYIHQCIKFIREYSDDGEIIIVDNSGKNYGYDRAIVNKSGSYPSALNQGIKLARYDYLVCCNADIIVQKDWLKKFKYAIDNGYGMVGPMSDKVSGIQGSFANRAPIQIKLFDVGYLIGFCFMLRKSVYEKVGQFDERFEFGCDDIDYSVRVRSAGYKIAVHPGIFIKHLFNKSAKTNSNSGKLEIKGIANILKKYPNLDFRTNGIGWYPDQLALIEKDYPEVRDLLSFQYVNKSILTIKT